MGAANENPRDIGASATSRDASGPRQSFLQCVLDTNA